MPADCASMRLVSTGPNRSTIYCDNWTQSQRLTRRPRHEPQRLRGRCCTGRVEFHAETLGPADEIYPAPDTRVEGPFAAEHLLPFRVQRLAVQRRNRSSKLAVQGFLDPWLEAHQPLLLRRGETDLVAAVEDLVGDKPAHGLAKHVLGRAVTPDQ